MPGATGAGLFAGAVVWGWDAGPPATAGTGSYFVWIGASLTAAGVVPAGTYTQPITLEVFYN